MFFTIQSQPHNGFKDLKVVFRVCVFNPTFLIGAKTLHLMCVYQKGMLISSEIIEIYIAIKNPVSNYSSVTVAHFILYFFNTTCNGSVSSSSSPFCTGLFWHHKKYTSLSGAISYICLKKKKKCIRVLKVKMLLSWIVRLLLWNPDVGTPSRACPMTLRPDWLPLRNFWCDVTYFQEVSHR